MRRKRPRMLASLLQFGAMPFGFVVDSIDVEEAPPTSPGVEFDTAVDGVLRDLRFVGGPALFPCGRRPFLPPSPSYGPILRGKAEEEEGARWSLAGKELRNLADVFHLKNAEVCRKKKAGNMAPFDPKVLYVFGRCLSACLTCLAWWRLLNRFR